MMILPPISAAFVLEDGKVQLPTPPLNSYTIFYTLLVSKKQRFLFPQEEKKHDQNKSISIPNREL